MGKNKFKKKPGASLVERKQRLKEASRQLAKGETKDDKPKFTVDQLLTKAQDYIDKFEYEMAQKFCQRALEVDADNVRALETTGSLLLEMGNVDAAKQCYGRAVEVKPDEGYLKYMNLGQLLEGAEAVQCYQKGIELMVSEKAKRQSEEVNAACGGETGITDRDISTAYLSIAEIYMTDCCFEENAEAECKSHIEKSIEADKDNPDALQLMASFHLSKENNKDAKEMIKKSVNMWLPDYLKSEQQPGASNMLTECPQSYESRLSAGKILIEVEEYEMAVEVLETLLEEDDEAVDTWYLIGWASYLLGDKGKDSSRSYLNKAKFGRMAVEVLETLLEEDDEAVDTWYLIGWASYLLGDKGKDSSRSYLNKAKFGRMAVEVLETLLEEDDEAVDTWYLIGWASYLLGDKGKDSSRSYLNKAKKLYKKVKCKDAELLKHIDELLESLGAGEDPLDSDAEADDDDYDYEDIQSDDDDDDQTGETMEH